MQPRRSGDYAALSASIMTTIIHRSALALTTASDSLGRRQAEVLARARQDNDGRQARSPPLPPRSHASVPPRRWPAASAAFRRRLPNPIIDPDNPVKGLLSIPLPEDNFVTAGHEG